MINIIEKIMLNLSISREMNNVSYETYWSEY